MVFERLAAACQHDPEKQHIVIRSVVEHCPILGCWLKLRNGSGKLFADLAPARWSARGIPIGSTVAVTGIIGKNREAGAGVVASRVQRVAAEGA